jgi:hypothetical protein
MYQPREANANTKRNSKSAHQQQQCQQEEEFKQRLSTTVFSHQPFGYCPQPLSLTGFFNKCPPSIANFYSNSNQFCIYNTAKVCVVKGEDQLFGRTYKHLHFHLSMFRHVGTHCLSLIRDDMVRISL